VLAKASFAVSCTFQCSKLISLYSSSSDVIDWLQMPFLYTCNRIVKHQLMITRSTTYHLISLNKAFKGFYHMKNRNSRKLHYINKNGHGTQRSIAQGRNKDKTVRYEASWPDSFIIRSFFNLLSFETFKASSQPKHKSIVRWRSYTESLF